MKTTTAKTIGLAIVLALASVGTSASGSESSILPGWDADFVAVTNRAFASHAPIVMIWANQGCEFCEQLESEVRQTEFVRWREASPYEFCFVMGVGGKDPANAKAFAQTAGGTQSAAKNYPFECLYWAKADGTVVAERFSRSTAAYLRQRADALFADYVPMPAYIGGDLAFASEYPQARLEAEAGLTKYVGVPLVRAADASRFAATNTVTAKLGVAEILSESVAWSVGETEKSIRIPIPSGVVAGNEITVSLLAGNGEARGTVRIFVVGEVENSTRNPLFIGERTAQTLGYGEWTMDLDVAIEKYRAEPDSHLVAAVSGALWCPDCVMAERHVLETDMFKKWADANKVILVCIDVPNFPNTASSACLTTRVTARTSDGYVSGRGTLPTNELTRYQSGAGYLSRHMVSDAAAAAVLARNKDLVGKNSLDGGWNSPSRANQNRTGVPDFFALTRDGRLAGTFETFDAIGPFEFKAAYIDRFTELIKLGEGGTDDLANRSWQTTRDLFPGEGETSATLSSLDLADTYALAPTTDAAAEQTVTARGNDSGVTVTVNIIRVADGVATTVATAAGSLVEGVSATGVIAASGGDYYVSVVADQSGSLAADISSANTATAYTLSGSRKAIENPFSNDWIKTAAQATLPLYAADSSELVGTIALTLKNTGKISAKYTLDGSSIATFSGKWDSNIAADGTATATLEKKGRVLELEMDGDGTVSAVVTDGGSVFSSGECGLDTDYGDFAGVYTVALPANNAVHTTDPAGSASMTLKMASTSSARKAGKFRYTVYLPDGKRLSGATGVTWLDANFGVIPIAKKSGSSAFSAALKLRRTADKAPSTRAIVAVDGVDAVWTSTDKNRPFRRTFGVYGSWYKKNASLLTGIAGERLVLSFEADASVLDDSPAWGALATVAGNGAAVTVTDTKMTAEKTTGFTFKLNRTTGVFTGTAKLAFEGKTNVSAKFTGVLARGWFSDCDCGEDTDELIEMENVAFGLGHCVFSDRIGRRSVKRSFPIKVR